MNRQIVIKLCLSIISGRITTLTPEEYHMLQLDPSLYFSVDDIKDRAEDMLMAYWD